MTTLTLAGCASSGDGNRLPRASTQPLNVAVKVTPDCARLAKAVPHPAARAGDDARAVIGRYAAALEKANATIGATASCIAELSARYANFPAGKAK